MSSSGIYTGRFRLWLLLGLWSIRGSLLAGDWGWWETAHFQLLSNVTDPAARDAIVELEEFRAIFQHFSGLTAEIPQRNVVVLFASEKDFAPYRPQYQGKRQNVAGYFTGSAINAFMVLAKGREEEVTKHVLYHEFVHALYREVGWDPPLWFNEGTAEVLSSFQIKKNTAEIGHVLPGHLAQLRAGPLLPLDRLFRINHSSSEYNEARKQGIYYAESWALVHFLMLNPDRSITLRFHSALPTLVVDPTIDFAAAMGLGTDALYSGLLSYIQHGVFRFFKEPVAPRNAATAVTNRPASATERDCVLETVKAMANPDEGIAYNLILLEEHFPSMPLPREMRAAEALRAGDQETAEKKLWEAVKLGSGNVRIYWFLASKLADDWLTSDLSPEKRIGAETAQQLRTTIQKVLAAYPDETETWEDWARTEAFAPDPQSAAADAIERAARQYGDDPHATKMLLWVGMIRMRLGEDDAANKLAQYLDREPRISANIRELNHLLLGRYLTGKKGT